jgi:hypothetical protein
MVYLGGITDCLKTRDEIWLTLNKLVLRGTQIRKPVNRIAYFLEIVQALIIDAGDQVFLMLPTVPCLVCYCKESLGQRVVLISFKDVDFFIISLTNFLGDEKIPLVVHHSSVPRDLQYN